MERVKNYDFMQPLNDSYSDYYAYFSQKRDKKNFHHPLNGKFKFSYFLTLLSDFLLLTHIFIYFGQNERAKKTSETTSYALRSLDVMTMKTNREAKKKFSRIYFHHSVNKREAFARLMVMLIILPTTLLRHWRFGAFSKDEDMRR